MNTPPPKKKPGSHSHGHTIIVNWRAIVDAAQGGVGQLEDPRAINMSIWDAKKNDVDSYIF